MSLASVIEAAKRGAVTPVTALPATDVTRKPLGNQQGYAGYAGYTEKALIHAEAGQGAGGSGGRQESENGEVSLSDFERNPCNPCQPLTERQLVQAVAKAARRFGLEPALLWSFLCIDDFEAIRTGRADELRALWAFAELRSLSGDTTKARRGLPFPGAVEAAAGAPRVRCGDCGHFQLDSVGDGTGIGRCGRGIEPAGGLMYPGVERSCGGFQNQNMEEFPPK